MDYKSTLARLLTDPQFRADTAQNARSALAGALRGVTTDALGAPSDLLSMFKYNTLMGGEPTKIPLGSEQLGNYAEQAGILPPRENNVSYKAGEFLGPIAAIGVPKAVSAAGDVVGNALGDLVGSPMRAQYGAVGDLLKMDEYKIAHRPMEDAGGASRLHDLTPAFGEDVYGKNALQYFGSGDAREARVLKILHKLRGNPDGEVTIYRGIPADAESSINHGDWVTLDKEVAQDYGPQVVIKKVKAADVTSWPDSLLEFGYFPESK